LDIDKLFNNDDTTVLKDNTETVKVPDELDIKKKSNRISRPKDAKTENKRIIDEKKKLDDKIENDIQNNITEIKSLNNFEQVKKYIKQVLKFKNESKEQSIRNKNIINQLKNKNIYKSTDCEFHIFQPRHIMGDTIYCSCKFCSVEKHFSQSEWDE
jgi:hypothetical protein